MRTIHILTRADDSLAIELWRESKGQDSLLLLQDAVLARIEGEGLYACEADVVARGIASIYPRVSYDEIIDLILSHDRVICW